VVSTSPDRPAGSEKEIIMTKFLKKLSLTTATLVLATFLATAAGSAPANALTPAQSTSTGTVNTLIPDVNNFWQANMNNWGWSSYYRVPTVYFYNSTITRCGINMSPANSWACSGSYLGQIYIGTGWTQGLLNSYGDYAPGVILAHEWGHEIMYDLGWNARSTLGRELFADCLAGMYTHYGLLVSHKLNNSDFWEGDATLRAIAGGDHGTPTQRSAWYQYGYTQYNINSCYRALAN
jgi:predicted metalloprotease